MAFTATRKCRFPNDLDFAAKQLDAELANRALANQALLQDAISAASDLDAVFDEGFGILDAFFVNNDPPPTQRPTSEYEKLADTETIDYDTSSSLKNSEDVASEFGLLPDKPTEEQCEKFVTNSGIILYDNVAYLPGANSGLPYYIKNIYIFRRMYFSLDEDLKRLRETLAQKSKTVFTHNKLYMKIIPPKTYDTPYSLNEIREMTGKKSLTLNDVAYAKDNSAIVLLQPYLSTDKSKAETLRTTGISETELITNVFHFGSVDNSSSAISRYNYLGYQSSELGAILDGKDLVDANPSSITDNIEASKTAANKLIQYVEFLAKKYDDLNPSFKVSALDQIKTGIADVVKTHKMSISSFLFEVSVVQQKDLIDILSKKHSDEKIEYLFKNREDIVDIWFDADENKLLESMQKVLNAAPVASTYISNKKVNTKDSSTISQATLVQMYADLYDADRTANASSMTKPQLQMIKEHLTRFLGREPVGSIEITAEILQGQPSAATPASILSEYVDTMKTFDLEEKKEEINGAFKDLYDTYPASIAGPLSDVINKITDIFEKTMKTIRNIINVAQKTLMAMKKRLDSFISKYLSLTGNASFERSILKCAVNWDIGLSTDIIDRLFDFFFRFMAQLLAFLTKLKDWIADILTKLLCFATDLLNNILGQVSLALPSACKIPRFSLGAKLEDALTRLKNVSTSQDLLLSSFGKDIAKLKLEVRAAPDKLGQFKQSANCASSASSNFMNASMLNVGVGVG